MTSRISVEAAARFWLIRRCRVRARLIAYDVMSEYGSRLLHLLVMQ
jgi:hypothetical protein